MSVRVEERLTRIHDLELRRQAQIHKTALIYRDEEARLLKLRAICLQGDISTLNHSVAAKDARINILTKQGDQLRLDLDSGKGATRTHEVRFKKQAVEITNLKAEIDSLNEASQDSSKTIQEKFALTRELNRLRPELEHMKTQLTNYDAMVSERRDLQRQLDSLEVELDNEKRSRQRNQDKDHDNTMKDLKSKLEKAEKRLCAEKKERDSAKSDHEQALSDAQSQVTTVEQQLSILKKNLKSAQEELKDVKMDLEECQTELNRARSGASGSTEGPARPQQKHVKIANPEPSRKHHQAERGFEDITVATPGNEAARNRAIIKNPGNSRRVFGEKSDFSITPFLNRSRDAADESLDTPESLAPKTKTTKSKLGHEAKAEAQQQSETTHTDEVESDHAHDLKPKPKTKKVLTKSATQPSAAAVTTQKRRGRPKKADTSAPSKGAAVPPQEEPPAVFDSGNDEPAIPTSLEDKENDPPAEHEPRKKRLVLDKGPEPVTAIANTSLLGGDGIKRKRKLFGGPTQMTFDDDEESTARPAKIQVGGARRLKAPLGGGTANAFGGKAFSPLKRDRRGVNASFLG